LADITRRAASLKPGRQRVSFYATAARKSQNLDRPGPAASGANAADAGLAFDLTVSGSVVTRSGRGRSAGFDMGHRRGTPDTQSRVTAGITSWRSAGR
jgi:hypothetical protein